MNATDAEVREAIMCDEDEWAAMGWELRDWYRWLINSAPVRASAFCPPDTQAITDASMATG